jgi:hypothetical protein
VLAALGAPITSYVVPDFIARFGRTLKGDHIGQWRLPAERARISVLDYDLTYPDRVYDAWCGRNGLIEDVE